MTFILLPRGASTKKCLQKGILNKQYGLEGEIVLSCSLSLMPYYAMWYNLVNIAVCIVFDSNWMTCSQLCQSASNSRMILSFFMHENETLFEIHRWLLAYYGEDTVDTSTVHHWVRKSWDNGGNLDMNDQPQSGRPVRATHNLKRQRVIQENRHISRTTIVDILNTGLPMSMTLQNLCAWWVLHKFTSEMKRATQEAHQHLLTCYKSDGNDFMHSNVTGDES